MVDTCPLHARFPSSHSLKAHRRAQHYSIDGWAGCGRDVIELGSALARWSRPHNAFAESSLTGSSPKRQSGVRVLENRGGTLG